MARAFPTSSSPATGSVPTDSSPTLRRPVASLPPVGRSPRLRARAGFECDDVFVRERPRLVGLAYRLLGSLTDAEDVVQEAWMRWNRTDQTAVQNPSAWLTTVVSRIGIDRLRARQRDQADYVGPWLPEPLVSFDDEPAVAAELSDSLTTAFLVLLERLTPDERLVLLLADVFQQPFSTVAEVVGKSEDATRQMAVRARRKVRSDGEARHANRRELQ